MDTQSEPPTSYQPELGRLSAIPDFRGRVAVITGAGQGIGREYARRFAEVGARVAVVDVNGDGARSVAGEISDAGGTATAHSVDVSDETSVAAMTAEVLAEWGQIDILVNNAAVFAGMALTAFEDIALDDWEKMIRVNVTGSFLCAKHVAAAMRSGGYGRIINISSAGVSQGLVNCLHYTTSKSAISGMTYSLARELGSDGITVNAIAPGGTQTEIARKTQTDEGRALMLSRQCIKRAEVPADLVGLALFLASPAAAFLTGQVIACDGGSVHR